MPFKSVGHQVFITRAQLPAKNYHIEFNFGLASQHWGRFIDHLEPYISVGRRELFPKAHERLVHGRNSARFYPVKLFDMQSPCMSEFSIPFTVKFALANLFFLGIGELALDKILPNQKMLVKLYMVQSDDNFEISSHLCGHTIFMFLF